MSTVFGEQQQEYSTFILAEKILRIVTRVITVITRTEEVKEKGFDGTYIAGMLRTVEAQRIRTGFM